MPLVPAICTQCGAQIEVDNTHEAGICKHCGTAFITEKAINNYNTHITNNFAGATVHMHEESELERLITAADTFKRLGDNKSAAKNYEEAFKKYPQDPRGWVGYIYTSEEFYDFFWLRPDSMSPYVKRSLHEHPVFKTACQLADPETRERLEQIAAGYRSRIEAKDAADRQKKDAERVAEKKRMEDYHANYSLENLIKAVGDDIYCYENICDDYDYIYYTGYYKALFVRDGVLYHCEMTEKKTGYRADNNRLYFNNGHIYRVLPLEERLPRGQGFPSVPLIIPKNFKEAEVACMLWDVDYSNREEIYINEHDGYRKIYKKLTPPMRDKINDYIAKSWEQHENELRKQQEKQGYCYIATCVYGSYDCPQVWTLRRFRDNTLGSTWYGKLFIKCYYAVSPTLVKWFGNQNWFRIFWKKKLDRMVSKLNQQGVEDTRYSDKY